METPKDDNDNLTFNCVIKQRVNPQRRREKVVIGCGAGFAGDRPMAAYKLLQRVQQLNYLVLECLAERTLADRYQVMMSGGDGYDPRISEWMRLLLPLAVKSGTCIITNMGAMDPIGAQETVLQIASSLGLNVSVAVAHEVDSESSRSKCSPGASWREGGTSTYLGAAPIVQCLEMYEPNVIITSRVADAALFLAPMVYELGWNWDDLDLLAQGALAGHLLECGCQLTGGYFMHPGDEHRDIPFSQLLDLSLPFAEVNFQGEICVAKADGSGGVLNFSTCAQQLLYEIGDPSSYITPDVVLDIGDVTFTSLSSNRVQCTGAKPSTLSLPEKLLQLVPTESGWKGWGEISYGGSECVKRAEMAEFLVRSWMEETCPGVGTRIISYIIGLDSLKASSGADTKVSIGTHCQDIRLRMDGLFELMEDAVHFAQEFMALYTNGPAGGGGISTGHKKEIILGKQLVDRDSIFWRCSIKSTKTTNSTSHLPPQRYPLPDPAQNSIPASSYSKKAKIQQKTEPLTSPAPSGEKIPLYKVAHSRAGDKGNDLNFSVIPHYPPDIERLKASITVNWVKQVVAPLLSPCSFPEPEAISRRDIWVDENVKVEIYEVKGVHALNVVVRNILDEGVNASRRIDRHGKTTSDVILNQDIVLL